MVATFVRLKLRLMRNTLRISKQAAIGFWSGQVMILVLAVTAFGVLWETNRDMPELVDPVVIVAVAMLGVLWLVVPLTVGYTDGTVDPLRLVSLPLSQRRIVVGLLAAALTSPMPVFTFAVLHAPVVFMHSPAEIIAISVNAAIGTVLVVIVSQVGASAASVLITNRGTRDLMSVALMMVAISVGLGLQFGASSLGASEQRWWSIARWARLTPGGWLGQTVIWMRAGQWLGVVALMVLSCVAIVVLVLVWARLLDRMLTSKPQQVSSLAGSDAASAATVRGTRWLPAPLDATTTRALRSLRRDHREWAGILTSVPLMLFAAIPLAGVEQGEATLLVAGAGSYLGLTFMSLFAFDGSAVWLDLTAARSMRDVLLGKSLARIAFVTPLLALAGVGVALLTGGWRFLPAGLLLAVAGLLIMMGTGAVVSVRYAVAMPDMANQFSGQAGQSSAFLAFLGALALGILLVVPAAAAVAALSYWRWWAGLLAAPFGLVYGMWLGWRGLARAGTAADDRGPELLAKLVA